MAGNTPATSRVPELRSLSTTGSWNSRPSSRGTRAVWIHPWSGNSSSAPLITGLGRPETLERSSP